MKSFRQFCAENYQLDEKNKGDQELRKKAKGYDSFTEKKTYLKK